MKDGWTNATKKEPCPVCDSPDWCSIGPGVVVCRRVKSNKPKTLRDGSVAWVHANGTQQLQPVERKPEKPRLSDKLLDNRWAPRARAWWTGVEAWKRVQDTAEALGVAESALAELCVGFDGQATTWPEKNGSGLIVGVKRRLPDGAKVYHVGSRAGLSYSETFADCPGPILVVEGGSDVAAGITLGLATVGRPSNTGGVEYLVRLLRPLIGRPVLVIGERDRKKHADLSAKVRERHGELCGGCAVCWPGWYGALSVAVRLQKRMDAKIRAVLLPDEAKDIRAWLVAKRLDVTNVEACHRVGQSLLRRLRCHKK